MCGHVCGHVRVPEPKRTAAHPENEGSESALEEEGLPFRERSRPEGKASRSGIGATFLGLKLKDFVPVAGFCSRKAPADARIGRGKAWRAGRVRAACVQQRAAAARPHLREDLKRPAGALCPLSA